MTNTHLCEMSKRMIIEQLIATEEYRLRLYKQLENQKPECNDKQLTAYWRSSQNELRGLTKYQEVHNGN